VLGVRIGGLKAVNFHLLSLSRLSAVRCACCVLCAVCCGCVCVACNISTSTRLSIIIRLLTTDY
jgi:hypothetical protein